MEETITCSNCGRVHSKRTRNCCWRQCGCGKRICGGCGSTRIEEMEMAEDDDEAQYWCCEKCADCELEGCSMCI